MSLCQHSSFHLETARIFTLFHLPINLTHALRWVESIIFPILWKSANKLLKILSKIGLSNGGKTFPLSLPTSLDVWNFSFGFDRVLLEAKQNHSGTELWLWLLSLIFSFLCKYAPIPTHITQREPTRTAVLGFMLTTTKHAGRYITERY